MSRTFVERSPLNAALHLVLDAANTSYETGPMTFDEVVELVRDGQFEDVHRVLSLTFVDGVGTAADVTREVACAIYVASPEHPIDYDSKIYNFIERELSCQHAEECAWVDMARRYHDRSRDLHRRNTMLCDA